MKNNAAEEGRTVDPFLSIAEVSDLIRGQAASPVDIVRGCLQRIEASQPMLNAFVTVLAGPPGRDRTVLRVAHAYQQATPWSRMHPARS